MKLGPFELLAADENEAVADLRDPYDVGEDTRLLADAELEAADAPDKAELQQMDLEDM